MNLNQITKDDNVDKFNEEVKKIKVKKTIFGIIMFVLGLFVLLTSLWNNFNFDVIFAGILFFIFGLFCIFYYNKKLKKLRKEDEKYLKIKINEQLGGKD